MINVKITNRTAAEDYIAVEKETGATTLPGKHIFAIFSVGIISVLLALPFGSIIPESASPFAALTSGREEQNRIYEQEYLKTNEVIAEANAEISSTAGSEENYDDDINTEALIAQANAAESKKEAAAAASASSAEPERLKFVASDIEKNSKEKILADQKVQSEKYISNILTPDKIPGSIQSAQGEKTFNGKWYEQTIRKGDSLSKIFSYLNLNSNDLKKITAVARESDLNLSVGGKIQFLIGEDNSVQEIAIPLAGNKQVRFSRDIEKNTYTVERERRFAQFSDLKSRGMDSATLMPSFIEAEKQRSKKKLEEEALLSQKQKEALEKARLKREQLAAAQKKQEQVAAPAEKDKTKSMYSGKTRPRLIIGSINEKETFDKAAARYGLTRSEIVTIKNQYVGRINFNKLSAGDSFRILFNGIGQGSSMTAISMNTKMFGQINLYRHQLNHIFYEENGYNPSTGAFRRFPIMGQIKVSSPFNLKRFHPIKHIIRPHYGVDFKVNIGTPIYSPADGVVTYAKYMRGGGYSIIISHNGGYSTVYMHLSKFDVQQGDRVHIGQIIAKSGNTGNSTGAHLHYEVHVNGRPVDPLKVDLPSGSPATAQRLKEAFKNNVYILKTELYKNKLAEVK